VKLTSLAVKKKCRRPITSEKEEQNKGRYLAS